MSAALPRRHSAVSASVLFGVGSWGLGHATRDLPLILGLLGAGHRVTVLGSGTSLALLRRELGDRCRYLEIPGMRVPLGRTPFRFYFKYTLTLPLIWWETLRQRAFVQRLLASERFDVVVSDNRYGVWSWRVPSILIAHGLRFIAPGRNHLLELGLEWVNARCFRGFRWIAVPDFECNDLSGDLSHGLRFYDRGKIAYLGLLSSVEPADVPMDLDVFISISGPEPQRTLLERQVLRQLPRVPAHGLVALGSPQSAPRADIGGWHIEPYLDRRQQASAMNRCCLAVVRGGYTTLMELAALGKPAVLIPTPGQTEQEYLASYQAGLGRFFQAEQQTLDLSRLAQGRPPNPYQPAHLTAASVDRFLDLVASC
ncbi:MAG: glycosyltransferase [Chloroflexota bacterium]